MSKAWDDSMKRVFASRPQDFVHWLLPGATLLSKASLELKTLTRTIDTDSLYKVLLDGHEAVLHIEFQRYSDPKMANRVWEYNVLATLEHKCPVYSYVIYLQAGGKIAESPLVWSLPGHESIHVFQFWNLKLWEVPADTLLQAEMPGLLPLCMLARDGKQHEMAEAVFHKLTEERELLTLALTFASMAFDTDDDQQWLERKMMMLEEIIQDTWFYKRILQKGEAEGEVKGRAEGRAEGIRVGILTTLEERFPEVIELARTRLEPVQDFKYLLHLHSQLIMAPSRQEVEQILLNIDSIS
jgi:predicted transposase YdaD